jgi:tmRNA-binding protein
VLRSCHLGSEVTGLREEQQDFGESFIRNKHCPIYHTIVRLKDQKTNETAVSRLKEEGKYRHHMLNKERRKSNRRVFSFFFFFFFFPWLHSPA